MVFVLSLGNLPGHVCKVVLINALENYNRVSVELCFTATWIPKQCSMIHILTMNSKDNNNDFDKVLPNIYQI